MPVAGAVSDSGNIREVELFKAPDNTEDGNNDLFSELSVKAELYNENFDEVPMLFKRLVGSQEIALKIKQDDGNMLYATAIMRGGMVGEFYSYDTPEDPNSKFGPSMTVETDEQTVREILDSEDPLKEAVQSMNEGTLVVEVEGFFRKAVLWTITKLYS
jgi:hypothetical protein